MSSILDCKKIQAGLSEYVDSALPHEQMEATRTHLRTCAVCTQVADELAQTVRVLAFMPRQEPSASFEQQLAARLAGQALRPKPITLMDRLAAWWIRPRVRPVMASALAVALVVPAVLSGLTLLPERSPRPLQAAASTSPAIPPVTVESSAFDQAIQEHLSAKTSEAFGDSSGVLLVSTGRESEL